MKVFTEHFFPKYLRLQIIINGTEFFIETATLFKTQVQTWYNNKYHNTWNSLWTGRVSGKGLTKCLGLPEKLNREMTLWLIECSRLQIFCLLESLLICHLSKEERDQLNPEETDETSRIGAFGRRGECTIDQINNYHILDVN